MLPRRIQFENTFDKFTVILNVDAFEAAELKVDLAGQVLAIVGNHDEHDEGVNGTIARSFTRRYLLPEDCDLTKVKSHFSEGKLTIDVPKKRIQLEPRNIPLRC